MSINNRQPVSHLVSFSVWGRGVLSQSQMNAPTSALDLRACHLWPEITHLIIWSSFLPEFATSTVPFLSILCLDLLFSVSQEHRNKTLGSDPLLAITFPPYKCCAESFSTASILHLIFSGAFYYVRVILKTESLRFYLSNSENSLKFKYTSWISQGSNSYWLPAPHFRPNPVPTSCTPTVPHLSQLVRGSVPQGPLQASLLVPAGTVFHALSLV